MFSQSIPSVFTIYLFFISSGYCKPSFFEPCNTNDLQCLREQTQNAIKIVVKGIPELDDVKLDPLHVDKADVNVPGFKLHLTDLSVKGFKKAIAKDVKFNLKGKKLYLDFLADFVIKAKYNVDGQIAILPIRGVGDAKFTLEQFRVKTTLDLDTFEKDGEKYLMVVNQTYDFEVQKKATFALTNLFDGNEQLAKPVLTFMNQNWKLMIESFGNDIFRPVYDTVLANIVKLIRQIPIKEIVTNFDEM